jgi:hypothetical protein
MNGDFNSDEYNPVFKLLQKTDLNTGFSGESECKNHPFSEVFLIRIAFFSKSVKHKC